MLEPGRAYRVHDVRAGEERVLASLPKWKPGAPPVRIVVPSKSLRLHWIQLLTTKFGAVLGVDVLTHHQLVGTILKEEEGIPLASATWARLEAGLQAADQPVLARSLDDLEDGYGIAVRSIEDLVEAGVRSEHVDALVDRMKATLQSGQMALPGGVGPRIQSLLASLDSTFESLHAQGACWHAEHVEAATDRLRRSPSTAFPASRVFVLGYSDATCAVADLIHTLCRSLDAVVMVNVPMSPARPSEVDSGIAFAQNFLDRFEQMWGPPIHGQPPSIPTLNTATDPYREAARVAARIGALIQRGEKATRIGVVVRDVRAWALPIRRVFRDHGIPFTGIGASVTGGETCRRRNALADCLRAGRDADAGRWLQAFSRVPMHELLYLLDSEGVRRVSDVCERIRPSAEPIPLPLRVGLREHEGAIVGRKPVVAARVVQDVRHSAENWCAQWNRWPLEANIGDHEAHLLDLLQSQSEGGLDHITLEVLSTILLTLPKTGRISRADFIQICCEQLNEAAQVPIGTGAGGVLVLDAMEARGRTFDHLFVMGMTRGSFPRVVNEDPLLPDASRRVLREVVPDIREKAMGIEEEHFLFALLMGSSNAVHLSYSHNDVANKPNHPSSLIVNLRLHDRLKESSSGPTELPRWQRTAFRASQGQDESGRLPTHLRSVAKARRGFKGAHLPYMGWIGPPIHPLDPRRNVPFITSIEAFARCPWGAHLRRDLSVSEPSNPWGELPGVTSHLLGRVVHDVIERAVVASRSSQQGEGPCLMQWPSPATLKGWTLQSAQSCLREDGYAWTGFAPAVVPFVEEALAALKDLDGPAPKVWAAEVTKEWNSPEGRVVRFRVDRVDLVDGQLYSTDFKLGKPGSTHKTEAGRRGRILELVREGRLLQGPLYALAEEGVHGRYVHLVQDGEYPERVFSFEANDHDVRSVFLAAFRELVAARRDGILFPNLQHVRGGKPSCGCEFCRTRETGASASSELQFSILEQLVTKNRNPAVPAQYQMWWHRHGGGDETK